MLLTASVALLAGACLIGLFVAVQVWREARDDRQWQRDHDGSPITRQSAENYVRRELTRCIKLGLFMTSAGLSVVYRAPRPVWVSLITTWCLIAVAVLLIEGAFRGRWERRRFMEIEHEQAQHQTQQRRRASDVPLPVVISEQLDEARKESE